MRKTYLHLFIIPAPSLFQHLGEKIQTYHTHNLVNKFITLNHTYLDCSYISVVLGKLLIVVVGDM